MSYQFLLASVAVVCAVAFVASVIRTRDVFHPNCIAALYIGGTIVGGGLTIGPEVIQSQYGADVIQAQLLYYIVGASAFFLGGLIGSGDVAFSPLMLRREVQLDSSKLLTASLVLGGIAWLIFILQVGAGGGFVEVYHQVKGRGDLGSGIQDFIFLAAPAAVLYIVAQMKFRARPRDIAVVLALLGPFLISGFLSSRRGPAAIALGVLFFGGYFVRGRRPSLPVLLAACAAGAFVLLFLLAYRDEIYLGSDILHHLSFQDALDKIHEQLSRPQTGQEFVYSSFVMQNADQQNDFWWGARYLSCLTLWLIPSFILQDKYQLFGLEGMLYNAGTNGRIFSEAGMAPGAAPMLMADAYVEFWYFALIFLFMAGFALALLWKRGLQRGGVGMCIYVCVLSLMVFLFSQTFAAFAQRLVVMTVPTLVAWRMVVGLSSPSRVGKTRAPNRGHKPSDATDDPRRRIARIEIGKPG